MTLTLTVGMAQEIRLESLEDGPGLLPFRLGPMRLVTHYHTFLQYIELTDIHNKVDLVQAQLIELSSKLPNITQSLFETQLAYLNSKLTKVTFQLKSLEPHRSKRGIIDGLGSVIKSLTGNLDYKDAIKYNNAIKALRDNQIKITSEINSHISLGKEWMKQHTNIISHIVDNQIKINETIHAIIRNETYLHSSLIRYNRLTQLLMIITDNVDELYDEIRRIEDILVFTRTSSTHHSMLRVDILQTMLTDLKKIYNQDQLLDLEIREYYDVIRTGSFYNNNQIVIVLKVPIISPHAYDLYKLPLAPNKKNQILLPPYPLVATSGNLHVYIEAECPKYNTRYICEEKLHQQIRSEPDCIQKILTHQTLEGSCELTSISIKKETIEKLDDRHYVVVYPQPTQVQITCGSSDYRKLQGSYLITIPYKCSLRSKEFTIYNSNDRIEGQPIKILNITTIEMTSALPPPILLSSINLKELQTIQDKIISQPPIQAKNLSTETLYHTTLPFYVVLMIIIIISITLTFRRYAACRKNILKTPIAVTTITEMPTHAHTYQIPGEEKSTQHPATFLLNTKK